MEPQDAHEGQNTSEEKIPFSLQKHEILILIVLAIFVLLFFITSAGMTLSGLSSGKAEDAVPQQGPEEGTENPLPISQTKGIPISSNTAHISLILPPGWEPISISDIQRLPEGAKDLQLAFREKINGCLIAYTSSDATALFSSYKQASFADRVFSAKNQFDGSWYVPEGEPVLFSDTERQYRTGEVRISSGGRSNLFVLWNEKGLSVADSCNEDLNSLLASTDYYSEPIAPSAKLSGSLWINKEFDDVKGGDTSNNLMYAPLQSQEHFKLLSLPPSARADGRSFVMNNKIYLIESIHNWTDQSGNTFSSGIFVIDPVARTVNALPGTEKDNSYISSIYTHNGFVYYIRGDSELGYCLDGYSDCRGDMYKIPASGGTEERIGTQVLAGSIAGYSDADSSFFLSRNTGDGGCSWRHYTELSNGKETDLGSHGSCEGDEEQETDSAAFEKIVQSIEQKMIPTVSAQTIGIENDVLMPFEVQATKDNYNAFIFMN